MRECVCEIGGNVGQEGARRKKNTLNTIVKKKPGLQMKKGDETIIFYP